MLLPLSLLSLLPSGSVVDGGVCWVGTLLGSDSVEDDEVDSVSAESVGWLVGVCGDVGAGSAVLVLLVARLSVAVLRLGMDDGSRDCDDGTQLHMLDNL